MAESNDTPNRDVDQCGHQDCNNQLEEGKAVRRAGSHIRYCSSEHLLADANNKRLNTDGSVIEPDRGEMPSKSGNDISVVIPLFDCPHCSDDSERVAREYGEWVHQTCGMKVSDHTAQTANEQLEKGEFDRGWVQHQANAAAQRVAPQLEEADQQQNTESDPNE